MSTPTFLGTALTSSAETQVLQPPQMRSFAGTVPGVEGVYTQENPVGGKPIVVSGQFAATGATPALAFAGLLVDIETIQALLGIVDDYVGTDARTYSNCQLQTYQHTQITTGPTNGAATFTSVCNVTAVLLHTVPSDVA